MKTENAVDIPERYVEPFKSALIEFAVDHYAHFECYPSSFEWCPAADSKIVELEGEELWSFYEVIGLGLLEDKVRRYCSERGMPEPVFEGHC
jgi:hypothetical protein